MTYLRKVERPHGLALPERQVRVGGGWVDIYYAGYLVVIELDGRAFHENSQFRDYERDNRNSRSGAFPLRYGWFNVIEASCDVAWQVAETLTARGWDGTGLRPCNAACPVTAPRLGI